MKVKLSINVSICQQLSQLCPQTKKMQNSGKVICVSLLSKRIKVKTAEKKCLNSSFKHSVMYCTINVWLVDDSREGDGQGGLNTTKYIIK